MNYIIDCLNKQTLCAFAHLMKNFSEAVQNTY